MRKRIFLILLAMVLTFPAYAALEIADMNELASTGITFTVKGMSSENYASAVDTTDWIEICSISDPASPEYDILDSYTYDDLESLFISFSAHSIAHTDVIGTSTEGRRIYSIRVGSGPNLIMVCAGTNAKEPAGTSFICAQLCSLVNAYEGQDASIVELLSQFTIVAIPCANPDGRQYLNTNSKSSWQANANGVDLALNFPSSNAGQLSHDSTQAAHETQSGKYGYSGSELGSEAETQALMGWVNEYIRNACIFIQYDHYGREIHSAPSYLSETIYECSQALASDIAGYLSRTNAIYAVADEDQMLRGWADGSICDYAGETADGLTFSEIFGRLGVSVDNAVCPLSFYKDVDSHSTAGRTTPFAIVSIEISTKGSADYYDNARRNHNSEYSNCGYAQLLPHLMEYALQNLIP